MPVLIIVLKLLSYLSGKSDKVSSAEKVLLAPEPVNVESSIATLTSTLTGT